MQYASTSDGGGSRVVGKADVTQRVPGTFLPVLLAGSMAAMLAALIHGLVDNSYFLEDVALLFWMLCAFVSYAATRSESSA